MKMKRLVTIALILIISMLLIACSKKIEPQGNTSTSEETQKNETIPPVITEPEEEKNETEIPVENVTEPIKNATEENITEVEENVTEEEPKETPEETPPGEATDCKSALNERCVGPPELNCLGKAELDLEEDTIMFSVKNELGYEIELINLEWFIEDEGWKCITLYEVEDTSVNIEGSGWVGINTNPTISAGQVFEIKIKLFNIEKGYVDQGFDLNYMINNEENIAYYRISAIRK